MFFMSETKLPLTSRSLAEILKDHGYETHPEGMAQPLGVDVEQSNDGQIAYFDVNADAVRKNNEVPDRPIRLTFDKAGMNGESSVWRLRTVAELEQGIPSKALDRQPRKKPLGRSSRFEI